MLWLREPIQRDDILFAESGGYGMHILALSRTGSHLRWVVVCILSSDLRGLWFE